MATLHTHGTPYDLPRRSMVDRLVQAGIKDPCVIAAMTVVPHELFAEPAELTDGVAMMIEALRLSPDDRVLLIGSDSGYAAGVLSQLASHVYSIEPSPALAQIARDRIAALGYDCIDIRCGDGALGWPEHAPFEAIAVMTPATDAPSALVRQLAIGGRMVMPIGRHAIKRLALLEKRAESHCMVTDLGVSRFA
jgi:protein-L-isoaspartate(D-aspartate) O-methyltransferase